MASILSRPQCVNNVVTVDNPMMTQFTQAYVSHRALTI